jgi:cold shock CspA family protein
MRYKGKVKSWKADKGFGFISPLEAGQTYCSFSDFTNRHRCPSVGDIVTYQVTQGRDNKRKAIAILFSDEEMVKQTHQSRYWQFASTKIDTRCRGGCARNSRLLTLSIAQAPSIIFPARFTNSDAGTGS